MARGSDPAKVRQWTKRLERFAKSGRSVSEFCEREGVSAASLYQWRQKLATVEQNKKNSDHDGELPGFQRVQVAPSLAGVSIRLPDGTVIDLNSDLATIEFVIGCLLDRQTAEAGGC